MEIMEFITWAIKRFLSIIIVTVGITELLRVYFPKIANYVKIEITIRLLCFFIFGLLCSKVYDTKEWSQYTAYWEVFAMSMVCTVFFLPVKAGLKPFIQGILSKYYLKTYMIIMIYKNKQHITL